MAKQKITEIKNTKPDESKKFEITEIVKRDGYSADIMARRFIITPQIKGATIDIKTNNNVFGVVTESSVFIHELDIAKNIIHSEKMEGLCFIGLDEFEERVLRIAGVIK